jgi:hypothetical protein
MRYRRTGPHGLPQAAMQGSPQFLLVDLLAVHALIVTVRQNLTSVKPAQLMSNLLAVQSRIIIVVIFVIIV